MTNPWPVRRVVCIAHQGGVEHGRPNTIDAIAGAVRAGTAVVDVDVRITADCHLVLTHDDEVAGVRVATSTLEQLHAVDADLATLPGLLASAAVPPVPLVVEIKDPGAAGAVIAALRNDPRRREVIISSKSAEALARVASAVGAAVTAPPSYLRAMWLAALLHRPDPPRRPDVAIVSAPWTLGEYPVLRAVPGVRSVRLVSRRFVQMVHRLGHAVHVWTVDDPTEVGRALDIGVDGVFTDRPSVVHAVLDERGVRWRP